MVESSFAPQNGSQPKTQVCTVDLLELRNSVLLQLLMTGVWLARSRHQSHGHPYKKKTSPQGSGTAGFHTAEFKTSGLDAGITCLCSGGVCTSMNLGVL